MPPMPTNAPDPNIVDAWHDLPMHPDTASWGENAVLPFAGAVGVMVYAAQSLRAELPAVILEFPSDSISLDIPAYLATSIVVERKDLPGLGPDRCTIVIELRDPHLAVEFMAFAGQI